MACDAVEKVAEEGVEGRGDTGADVMGTWWNDCRCEESRCTYAMLLSLLLVSCAAIVLESDEADGPAKEAEAEVAKRVMPYWRGAGMTVVTHTSWARADDGGREGCGVSGVDDVPAVEVGLWRSEVVVVVVVSHERPRLGDERGLGEPPIGVRESWRCRRTFHLWRELRCLDLLAGDEAPMRGTQPGDGVEKRRALPSPGEALVLVPVRL